MLIIIGNVLLECDLVAVLCSVLVWMVVLFETVEGFGIDGVVVTVLWVLKSGTAVIVAVVVVFDVAMEIFLGVFVGICVVVLVIALLVILFAIVVEWVPVEFVATGIIVVLFRADS